MYYTNCAYSCNLFVPNLFCYEIIDNIGNDIILNNNML